MISGEPQKLSFRYFTSEQIKFALVAISTNLRKRPLALCLPRSALGRERRVTESFEASMPLTNFFWGGERIQPT